MCYCENKGPGWSSPLQAMDSEKETHLYVPVLPQKAKMCVDTKDATDYLAKIDVDPDSSTYSQVVNRIPLPVNRGEFHHMGWNACSSCWKDTSQKRKYLILPNFTSGDIVIFDTDEDTVIKTITAEEVIEKTGLTWPHTAHCLADGTVMISMSGDKEMNGTAGFILLNQQFDLVGRWDHSKTLPKFGYDFWYQPYHNIMISSEMGTPSVFQKGFDPKDVENGHYGHSLNFWNWKTHELMQTIDLGERGLTPLEVRFLHNPQESQGYVGCALGSTVFRFYLQDDVWHTQEVIHIPPIPIDGWILPQLPALITDVIISLDDRFMYMSNWLHGDVRQYDITNRDEPKLVGQIFLGGIREQEYHFDHSPTIIKGVEIQGGPQMLQLSLDGTRLYVTNSLLSSWDKQFYPGMIDKGSQLIQIDVGTEQGGLTINPNFLVDFGAEPWGPALAHEVRLVGGDSSSDIWVE